MLDYSGTRVKRHCKLIASSYKIFYQKMFVSVLSSAPIFLKPNFEPLFYLKYMKIHIEVFPQSCIYLNYLSFAALVTLVTVIGAELFAFLCKVYLDKL